MDAIKNPFSPGAGSPPPELVGRDPVLEQARVLLGRVKAKRPEKSLLLTGLRGVGKTVLLNEIERSAKGADYRTAKIEAHEDKQLGPLMAPYLRQLLYDLDRVAGAGDKAKRGRNFLRAMAELGPGPQRTGDIAATLEVKVTSLGPVRAKLIKKGMIYSPAHGDMAFTVPLFDAFMIRAIPTFR